MLNSTNTPTPSPISPVQNFSNNAHFANADRAPYELGHLLRNLPNGFPGLEGITPEVRLIADAARLHAEYANRTLLSGLEALGHLMVSAVLIEGSVGVRKVAALGELVAHLAVEAQFVQELVRDIHVALDMDDRRALEEKTAGRGKKGGAA